MTRCVIILAFALAACGATPEGTDAEDTGTQDTNPGGTNTGGTNTGGTPGELPLEAFADAFVAAYCEAWASCNTSGEPCPLQGASSSTGANCVDYDAAAAAACVEGPFECDDSFGPGLEMVVPPDVCGEICEPQTTPGTTGSTYYYPS